MRLAVLMSACRPTDRDIAPDVAARAAVAARSASAQIDLTVETAALSPGATLRLNPVVYDSANAALPDRRVTYASSNPAVLSVDDQGRVTALAPGRAVVRLEAAPVRDSVSIAVLPSSDTARIVLFPERTFQTMEGWEAHHQAGEIDCNPRNFARYQSELYDRAVGDLGINRIRLEVRSGMEAPHLREPGGNEAQSTAVPFATPWFSPVNDNADPFVVDTAGFQFEWFDYNIVHSVLPVRERLARRGERLYLNLTYVDFFRQTPYEQMRNPEEYAELIALVFAHMQAKFGFVPDAVEAALEPDNTPWTPEQLGRAIVAAGDRLKAAGYHPDFIAPSTTNLSEAVRSYDRLRTVPRVGDYLTVLAYHRYSGITTAALRQLARRARRDGLRLAMLEHASGDARELHDDLVLGGTGISSWERFALAYCGNKANPDADGVYFQVQLSRKAEPRIVETNAARLLRHYFRYVRRGAVRIGAATTAEALAPVAFRTADGRPVVVLRADERRPFVIDGLAPGSYGVLTTNIRDYRSDSTAAVVDATGRLAGAIAAPGYLTVFPR